MPKSLVEVFRAVFDPSGVRRSLQRIENAVKMAGLQWKTA